MCTTRNDKGTKKTGCRFDKLVYQLLGESLASRHLENSIEKGIPKMPEMPKDRHTPRSQPSTSTPNSQSFKKKKTTTTTTKTSLTRFPFNLPLSTPPTCISAQHLTKNPNGLVGNCLKKSSPVRGGTSVIFGECPSFSDILDAQFQTCWSKIARVSRLEYIKVIVFLLDLEMLETTFATGNWTFIIGIRRIYHDIPTYLGVTGVTGIFGAPMLNPPPNHWNSPSRVMITMAYKHLQHSSCVQLQLYTKLTKTLMQWMWVCAFIPNGFSSSRKESL